MEAAEGLRPGWLTSLFQQKCLFFCQVLLLLWWSACFIKLFGLCAVCHRGNRLYCTLSWIVFIIALLKLSETWRIRRTEIFSINSVAQWNVNHTTDLNSCASCAWTCNEWARKINISTLESLLAWDTVISAGGGLLNRCSPGRPNLCTCYNYEFLFVIFPWNENNWAPSVFNMILILWLWVSADTRIKWMT